MKLPEFTGVFSHLAAKTILLDNQQPGMEPNLKDSLTIMIPYDNLDEAALNYNPGGSICDKCGFSPMNRSHSLNQP
jgi:hypothetical protein